MQIPFSLRHHLPEESIVTMEYGLSINTPVCLMMWPFWWDEEPETYERILALRAELGIVVDDWLGGPRPERDMNAPPPHRFDFEKHDFSVLYDRTE